MANAARPGRRDPDDSGSDINRAGQPVRPVDEEVVAAGADEAVYQSSDFPGGGGRGATDRGGPTGRPTGAEAGSGSTGRGSSDEGKTDAEGTAGGGMAGSAGG